MKGKQLILLVGAAAVLGGVALWTNREMDSSAAGTRTGEKVVPDLAVNDVAGISLQTAAGTTTVAQVDGTWRVKGKYNYPADFGRVRELVTKLTELKVLRTLRTTPAERADLQLLTAADPAATNTDGQAASLQLLDRNGTPMVRLFAGIQHSSRSAEGGPGGYPDGRFLMSEEGTVMLVNDPLQEFNSQDRDWLEGEFLNVNSTELESVAVRGATNGAVVAVKTDRAAGFALQGVIPAGKEVDQEKLNRLIGALGYLRFDDIADPTLPASQTGLDQPIRYQARTTKGEIYTVLAGKAVGTQRYAKVSVSFEAPEPGLPSDAGPGTNTVEQARKQAEANAAVAQQARTLNDKLNPWIYLLGAASAETITLGFTDVLKDKAEPTAGARKEEQQQEASAVLSGETP